MVDESCWLRMLPQALTEEEANSEIYRKGLCLMPACLPPPLRVTWLCLVQLLKGRQLI